MTMYILIAAAWVPVVVGLSGRWRTTAAMLASVLLIAAVTLRVLAEVDIDAGIAGLLAAVLAVAGGSLVTTVVFDAIDDQSRHDQDDQAPDVHDQTIEAAGRILRGGTWIGALERLAVFGSLASGMPGGVALVLAVKGLGRYPELRAGNRPATAERFIIGTLVSVLWAAACAYAATGFGPVLGGAHDLAG